MITADEALRIAAQRRPAGIEPTRVIGETDTDWVVGMTDGKDNLGVPLAFVDKMRGLVQWYVMPFDITRFEHMRPI
jgi:hypothetical protein